jgi:hypothetical protein
MTITCLAISHRQLCEAKSSSPDYNQGWPELSFKAIQSLTWMLVRRLWGNAARLSRPTEDTECRQAHAQQVGKARNAGPRVEIYPREWFCWLLNWWGFLLLCLSQSLASSKLWDNTLTQDKGYKWGRSPGEAMTLGKTVRLLRWREQTAVNGMMSILQELPLWRGKSCTDSQCLHSCVDLHISSLIHLPSDHWPGPGENGVTRSVWKV